MYAVEALCVMISSFILLRVAGKKVVAEMTVLEMITILAIGTIIGHAVSENSLLETILTIAVFVAILIVFQAAALKWRLIERSLIGKPTEVIRNGIVLHYNLSKLRMTVEQLDMRLRQIGVNKASDIYSANIEINGELGYELMDSAKPITRGELEQLLNQWKADLKLQQSTHDVAEQSREVSK